MSHKGVGRVKRHQQAGVALLPGLGRSRYQNHLEGVAVGEGWPGPPAAWRGSIWWELMALGFWELGLDDTAGGRPRSGQWS